MDNLMLGLKVAAIGIVAVFVVLMILMAVIKLFETIIGAVSKKAHANTPAPAIVSATPVAIPTVATEDDGELVAVISAAIMAILASETAVVGSGIMPSFQIKKIKEIKRN